jgi:release factor glutamine methyltransferase
MIDIKTALRYGIDVLKPGNPNAQIDVEVLLTHAIKASRTFLYTHPETSLKSSQEALYKELIAKRLTGYPIAYLIGEREFWSLPLQVNESTLIPRPETELLVELTLDLLKHNPKAAILDLGTGSGAIALALAQERPSWQITASDKNETAVKTARQNALHLNISNVKVVCSDWFQSLPTQQFNAIVSNPPYIALDDPHLTIGDLRFEPKEALVSGNEGLDDITQVIQQSRAYLATGGLLLLEHGCSQKDAVMALLHQNGYQNVCNWQDLQGLDRVTGGWLKT